MLSLFTIKGFLQNKEKKPISNSLLTLSSGDLCYLIATWRYTVKYFLKISLLISIFASSSSLVANELYADEDFIHKTGSTIKMDSDGYHPIFPVPEDVCVDTPDPHDEPCPSKIPPTKKPKPAPIYKNTDMNDRTWYLGFCQQNRICFYEGGSQFQEEVIRKITDLCYESAVRGDIKIVDIVSERNIPDHIIYYSTVFEGHGPLGTFKGQVLHSKSFSHLGGPEFDSVELTSGRCDY